MRRITTEKAPNKVNQNEHREERNIHQERIPKELDKTTRSKPNHQSQKLQPTCSHQYMFHVRYGRCFFWFYVRGKVFIGSLIAFVHRVTQKSSVDMKTTKPQNLQF